MYVRILDSTLDFIPAHLILALSLPKLRTVNYFSPVKNTMRLFFFRRAALVAKNIFFSLKENMAA